MNTLESLQREVKFLRRMIKMVATGIALLAIGVVTIAATNGPADKLELVSPNGRYKIILQAFDNIGGMWITDEQGKKPMVCIYNEKHIGPVLGLWGGEPYKGGHDVALSADDSGGLIQVVKRDGDKRIIHFITPTDKGTNIGGWTTKD